MLGRRIGAPFCDVARRAAEKKRCHITRQGRRKEKKSTQHHCKKRKGAISRSPQPNRAKGHAKKKKEAEKGPLRRAPVRPAQKSTKLKGGQETAVRARMTSAAHETEAQTGDDNSDGAMQEPHKVKQTLFACIDKRTRDADASALLRAEFDHDRRLVAALLSKVRISHALELCVSRRTLCTDTDNLDHERVFVVRRACGFSFDCSHTDEIRMGSGQDAADAIAVVCLAARVVPVRINGFDLPDRIWELWDRRWRHAVMASLVDAPGNDGWTPETICDTGTAIRALIDSSPLHNTPSDIPLLAKQLGCLETVATLASTLCTLVPRDIRTMSRQDHISLGMSEAERSREIKAEKSLRAMLAWIDAMERTDAIFEHGLKQYQAQCLDRMVASDSCTSHA